MVTHSTEEDPKIRLAYLKKVRLALDFSTFPSLIAGVHEERANEVCPHARAPAHKIVSDNMCAVHFSLPISALPLRVFLLLVHLSTSSSLSPPTSPSPSPS
jgi:hypothetical protein